jgi:hypothetical protein
MGFKRKKFFLSEQFEEQKVQEEEDNVLTSASGEWSEAVDALDLATTTKQPPTAGRQSGAEQNIVLAFAILPKVSKR